MVSYRSHGRLFGSLTTVASSTLCYAAVVQPIASIVRHENLTSFNLPIDVTAADYHCTRSRDWIQPAFEPDDCQSVIDKFREYEEKQHGQDEYEFLFKGVQPEQSDLRLQVLPRRYRSKSCAMTLVMMADPRLVNVEGRSALPNYYPKTDTSSYYDIWSQSLVLLERCMASFGIPGMITAGHRHSIGVFMIANGSKIDKQIAPGGFPDLVTTS